MVVTMVAGALYGIASLFYPAAKGFRAKWLAEDAEKALAEGHLDDAHKAIRSAIRMAPHEPGVVRATARFASKARNPEAFKYWLELVQTLSATKQDKIELVEAALAMDRLDLAQQFLQELLKNDPRDRQVLRLSAIEQAEFQNYPKAIEAAQLVLSLDPNSERDQIALARLEYKHGTPVERASGKSLLWSIALGKTASSVDAMGALLQGGTLTPAELEILLLRLQAEKTQTLAQRILAGSMEFRLHPDRAQALFERLFAGFETATTPEKSDLARWGLKQTPAQLADFLTPDRIGTNRTLLTIKAEALADTRRWELLEPLVTNPTNAFEVTGRAWLRARLALAQGQREAARTLLLEGINFPQPDPRALILLAQTAEAAGFAGDALHSWERLAENPVLLVQASREVMRLSAATGDLPAARRVIQHLNDYMPGDDSLAGERAILDALYGDNLPHALTLLSSLVKKRPEMTVWRHGLALAKFKNGEPQSALALIEDTRFEWKDSSPRSQAIYVAVLGANGQRETARRFARQIALEKLRDAERQLVDPWL
jgi:tetratricopeptide (TPR) repeat protein